jgi:DNA-binding transcriptional MocR family regulator
MLQLLETLGLKASKFRPIPHRAVDRGARSGHPRRPVAACLLVPNASNPLGSIMPDEHKRRLAKLTAERGLAVIEDDIYGDLYFGNERRDRSRLSTGGQCDALLVVFQVPVTALRIGFVAAGRYRHADRPAEDDQ